MMELRQPRIVGPIAYIPLTQGYEAIIDATDVGLVDGRAWYALVRRRKDGSVRAQYAVAKTKRENGRQRTIWMHRILVGADDDVVVDHKDGDGLNNRKSNIRLATPAENVRNQRISVRNTSGTKGVRFLKSSSKWHAQIRVDGKLRHLGLFGAAEDAAAAYAKASAEMHGEFGRLA